MASEAVMGMGIVEIINQAASFERKLRRLQVAGLLTERDIWLLTGQYTIIK